MKKLLVLFVIAMTLSACGNIREGTVVEKKKVVVNNEEECYIYYITDQTMWDSDEEQKAKKPVQHKVACNEKFDRIKVGDHWDEVNYSNQR